MRQESCNSDVSHDIVIARIVKARGIRGEVACELFTDFPEQFETLAAVRVALPNGATIEKEIESHWFHGARLILKFKDCDTMSDAEKLAGGQLLVRERDSSSLSEGEFFEYQIIGSDVVATDGERIGRVEKVLKTGGTDLLVVLSDDQREFLIPFADDICTAVDLSRKRVTVKPPEGLLDL